MNKFQNRVRTFLNWCCAIFMIILIVGITAVHLVKIPMIEPWNPPMAETVDQPLREERATEIRIVYVVGNGVRVHNRPSEASDAINAFNWCKSLIVFSHDREWVEIGDIEPMGWMHEAYLTNEKPDRCKEIVR